MFPALRLIVGSTNPFYSANAVSRKLRSTDWEGKKSVRALGTEGSFPLLLSPTLSLPAYNWTPATGHPLFAVLRRRTTPTTRSMPSRDICPLPQRVFPHSVDGGQDEGRSWQASHTPTDTLCLPLREHCVSPAATRDTSAFARIDLSTPGSTRLCVICTVEPVHVIKPLPNNST